MALRNRTFKEEHPLGALLWLAVALGNRPAVSLAKLTAAEAGRCCAEKRQAEAARIRDKYPDRIPVSPSTLCSGQADGVGSPP